MKKKKRKPLVLRSPCATIELTKSLQLLSVAEPHAGACTSSVLLPSPAGPTWTPQANTHTPA